MQVFFWIHWNSEKQTKRNFRKILFFLSSIYAIIKVIFVEIFRYDYFIKEDFMLSYSSVSDLNQTIPLMNMVALAVSIFLSIGIPIYAFLASKRQFMGRWQTIFNGVADFLMVEFFLANLVLFLPFLIPKFQDFVTKYPLPYCILCVILIGVVSEIGRYVLLSFSFKDYPKIGTSAMFATGVATARSLLLITWNAAQSLLVCMTVNQTGLAELAAAAGDGADEMLATLEPLFTVSWLTYLSSGIDVITNFVLHFAISMIFFAVLVKHAPTYLIVLAIGLRALYELPTYLYTYQVLFPTAFIAELCVVLIAAIIGYLGWTIAHKYCAEDIKNLHWNSNNNGKNKQAPFPKFNQNINK